MGVISDGNTVIDNGIVDGTVSWQSVQTTGFTATSGKGYPCNTTSAAFTVTFPSSPNAGDTIQLVDYAGTFETNNLTVNPNGNKIQSDTSNRLFAINRLALTFVYVDATQGWELSSGYKEESNPFYIAPYNIEFLVVAGGGGSNQTGNLGYNGGGGGGGY